jgi:hypothetical protein
MKNLPYILLLSLFSHTLLWGQDTLKFEPLQLVDTVYSFEELNKRGNVEYVFYGLDSNFKEMKDSTLFMLETNDDQFIVKKINNNWVVYNYGWHGISNYWHKVDNRFYIKVDAMGNSGGGDESDSCGYWRWSWSYNSIFIFDVIDMRISSEIYTWFERGGGYQYDDLEGDDYKQKLMKCRNMFEEFNAEYELKDETLSVSAKCNGGDYVIDPETSDRIMTIVSKSHCNEEGYLQAGEYHYINGNFVRIKPNEK